MNSPPSQSGSTCTRCGTVLTADELTGGCPRCLSTALFSSAALDPSVSAETDALRWIGDYELLEEIARGGMGIVFRARQISLNRQVAVKLMRESALASPEEVRRFRIEAAAAARLKHPNIVSIHEVDEDHGQHFFAMDLITGTNLAERTREGPLPVRKAAEIVATIADAVQHAHEQGVLHRDLKPSNVLLDATGKPFVTDFGLARSLDTDSDLTVTGQILGTPGYMPPEQATGKGAVGPAADIYSLGAVLYHLVTGRAPFVGDSVGETLRHVVEQEPVSPQLLNPGVPRDLASVCLKCLAKRPGDRYVSASDLAADLRRIVRGEPTLARPAGHMERLWRWCQRKPALAGALGATAALLLVVAIGSPIAMFRISAAHDAEKHERLRADERELTTRQNLYDVDMQLAQIALDIGDRQRTAMLLEREKPQPGQKDLRGWEWRYLWQLSRSDEQFTLGSHSNAVTTVDISPNGKLLVSGSYDHSVRVWDLPERRLLSTLAFPGSVYSVRFSPNGRFFAVGGFQTLKVFSADSQQDFFNFPAAKHVRAIAFTPDGKRLAGLGTDGIVNVWDLEKKALHVAVRTDSLNGTLRGALAFSPDGSTLAIGGENKGYIRFLDAESGAERFRILGHSNGVTGLGFTPDGLRLVSCGWDKSIKVWELATRRAVFVLTNHSSWVSSLAVSPDGKILATASSDQTIRLWDLGLGHQLSKLQGHLGEVWALVFAPDGRTIATGGKDESVKLWSTSLKLTNVLAVPSGTREVAFSPDGIGVALISSRNSLITGDAQSMQLTEVPAGQQIRIRILAYGPDSKSLATGNELGQLQLWDTRTWRQQRCITNHSAPIYHLHFSSKGDTIATVDTGGNYFIQSPLTGNVLTSGQIKDKFFNEHRIAFAPDNNLAAVVAGNRVRLIDLRHNQQFALLESQREQVRQVAYSPDGCTVACAVEDSTVHLWDVASRREISVLHGHRNGAYWVDFSPNGHRLITGGGEGLIKLWDLTTQREVATFDIRHHVTPSFMAGDGNTLLAKTPGGPWYLWHAPSWTEIEQTERKGGGRSVNGSHL